MKPLRGWAAVLVVAGVCEAATVSAQRVNMEAEYERAAGRLRTHLVSGVTGTAPRTLTQRTPIGCAMGVRVVFDPPAYPGTGVASTVVGPDGASYGQHGQMDIAPLVRLCRWNETPPTPALASSLLSQAYFEGLLATQADPVVERVGGGLRITVRSVQPMSGETQEVVVLEVPREGASRLVRTPVAQQPAAVSARDLLERAARDGSAPAVELAAAMREVRNSTDPVVRGWLVAITARPTMGMTLVGDALTALGWASDTGPRLAEAWRTLPLARYNALVELAEGLLGPEVRRELPRRAR